MNASFVPETTSIDQKEAGEQSEETDPWGRVIDEPST